jgi:hypothetical protein
MKRCFQRGDSSGIRGKTTALTDSDYGTNQQHRPSNDTFCKRFKSFQITDSGKITDGQFFASDANQSTVKINERLLNRQITTRQTNRRK